MKEFNQYKEADLKVGLQIKACCLEFQMGLCHLIQESPIKDILDLLFEKFGSDSDKFFFFKVLKDDLLAYEINDDHKRIGWDRETYVSWAIYLQELNSLEETHWYRIQAVRARLYYFYKPEYFKNNEIMTILYQNSFDGPSNFFIKCELIDESRVEEVPEVDFLPTNWRSKPLVLEKYGYKIVKEWTERQKNQLFYLVDYGTLKKVISSRKQFTGMMVQIFNRIGGSIDQMKGFMIIVDALYVESTKISNRECVQYVFFYAFPMILQMCINNQPFIIICLILCLIS